MENVFFQNKSEAGESGDYQNNIGVQSGEHRPGEQTLSNDPEDAKGRVKKKRNLSLEFSTPTRFFFFDFFSFQMVYMFQTVWLLKKF